MQQKKIGDILYVFDVTPYEITEDTSAEIIKVQEECVAGFKTLNASLADKIVAYNYHAIVAQVPVWAPYVDDVSPELAWSSNSATVTIGADDNVFPTLTNPHNVTVTYSSSDTTKATIDASTGAITLADAGNTTISATFAGNDTYYAQTVSYTLTVEEAQKQSPELAWSAESATVTIGADDNVFPTLTNPYGVTVTYNSTVTAVATVDEYGNITLISAGTTDIWALFAGNDTYNEQVVTYRLTVQEDQRLDPELSYNEANIVIPLAGGVQNELNNPNDLPVTFSSSDTSVATIDQSTQEVTLVALGTTTISASFEGNSTYKPQTVSYTLTVRNPLVYVGGINFDDSKFNVTVNGAAASYVDEEHVPSEHYYNYTYGPYANGTVVNVYPTTVPTTFKTDTAEWVSDHWTATVSNDEDLGFDFFEDPYTVTIDGDSVEDMNIYRNEVLEYPLDVTAQEWASGEITFEPSTQLDIYPINGNTSDYTVTGATLVNDHWTAIVEDNLTITVNAINQ